MSFKLKSLKKPSSFRCNWTNGHRAREMTIFFNFHLFNMISLDKTFLVRGLVDKSSDHVLITIRPTVSVGMVTLFCIPASGNTRCTMMAGA
jgi:hypothetical protein